METRSQLKNIINIVSNDQKKCREVKFVIISKREKFKNMEHQYYLRYYKNENFDRERKKIERKEAIKEARRKEARRKEVEHIEAKYIEAECIEIEHKEAIEEIKRKEVVEGARYEEDEHKEAIEEKMFDTKIYNKKVYSIENLNEIDIPSHLLDKDKNTTILRMSDIEVPKIKIKKPLFMDIVKEQLIFYGKKINNIKQYF